MQTLNYLSIPSGTYNQRDTLIEFINQTDLQRITFFFKKDQNPNTFDHHGLGAVFYLKTGDTYIAPTSVHIQRKQRYTEAEPVLQAALQSEGIVVDYVDSVLDWFDSYETTAMEAYSMIQVQPVSLLTKNNYRAFMNMWYVIKGVGGSTFDASTIFNWDELKGLH